MGATFPIVASWVPQYGVKQHIVIVEAVSLCDTRRVFQGL